MRTLAIFLIIAMSTTVMTAQRKDFNINTPIERNLYDLSMAINSTLNSKMTPEQKDIKVRKAIKYYMMTTKADEIITSSSCGLSVSNDYLQDLQMQNFDEVPSSYIKKKGNINNNCDLSVAVELYNMVGHNLVTNDQLCSIMGCDDLVVKRSANNRTKANAQISNAKKANPTSGPIVSATGKWKYTGVRRYFVEKEKFGWRYLCVDVNEKGIQSLSTEEIQMAVAELEKSIAMAEEASTRAGDEVVVPSLLQKGKYAWKLENQVNIW